MAEPQLSVRSARAREMAHRLARRERRSVAEIVERALEAYDIAQTGREPAQEFYARVSRDFGADVDLQKVIRENRLPNEGIEL
ncbi:MAG: plasmid stabilization protein [Proteobacteria bacterium]|nr:plasmid stabilization protein [Pseudomonadota bacterium]